jgi:HK97 family phage major capsid protein
MATMRDLLEARARTAAAMRELVDHPEDAGDLSADQESRFSALKDELGKIEHRVERQAIIDEADRRMAGAPVGGGDERFDAQIRQFSLQRAIAAQIDPRAVDAGREIEVSQELARRSGKTPQGYFVPLEAPVERRVQTGAGDAGQLIADDFLADQFIDALRPATVVGASGARMMTGLRGDVVIPKMDALTPAAEWVPENTALTGGDHSFTQLTGTPKHIGVLTEWSRKVMLQANPAIEQLVRSDFTQKLAAGVDLGALKGNVSSAQPAGVKTIAGIGSATNCGSHAQVVAIVAQVEGKDVPMSNLGWVGNAFVKAKMKTIARTVNDFLMNDTNNLGGYGYRVTSQLAGTTGTSTGEMIFGAWDQVILCFWGDAGADVLVNPYAATPYAKGNIQARAFVDADVVVRYPEAFVQVNSIAI